MLLTPIQRLIKMQLLINKLPPHHPLRHSITIQRRNNRNSQSACRKGKRTLRCSSNKGNTRLNSIILKHIAQKRITAIITAKGHTCQILRRKHTCICPRYRKSGIIESIKILPLHLDSSKIVRCRQWRIGKSKVNTARLQLLLLLLYRSIVKLIADAGIFLGKRNKIAAQEIVGTHV